MDSASRLNLISGEMKKIFNLKHIDTQQIICDLGSIFQGTAVQKVKSTKLNENINRFPVPSVSLTARNVIASENISGKLDPFLKIWVIEIDRHHIRTTLVITLRTVCAVSKSSCPYKMENITALAKTIHMVIALKKNTSV